MAHISGVVAITVRVFKCTGSDSYPDRALMRFDLRRSALAIAGYSLCLVLSLNTVSAQTPTSGVTLTANRVFQTNCARCHGKTAAGRHFGGPSLSSDKAAAASTRELHNIISNGKNHMPKYSGILSSDEIDTLVQQIKSLTKK
jgi:mono/diheme cytochrome c family protein